ncbi:EAL and HDOD domain-containing protein [Photobacterium aphoticum]|uniref:Histidine kinase n=1 Tax=Photobacterium aphoticum TaxID=754436 RepID=A0A0J1GKE2_9GAMM|nr:HDOD domain-containing protein [Photobacterium aphoticum]KLV00101.1 histidine kinase [Photobacterium aphoticum]PSU54705.1 HDOD domain-containing protein [Photobacterium aphoticum]GHA48737.1 histidine kinase [Photobacterium aphoticum]
MTNSYLARQPILNRRKETIGYELLFRDGPDNAFPAIEDEQATHRLLTDNFLGANAADISAGKKAFVNFPYSSLVKRTPLMFAKESFIIEILETCEPDDALLEAVIELHNHGYTLALDDFMPAPPWQRFLPYIHIIKFDIRAIPISRAGFFIRHHREKGSKLRFLAEKVESHAEFLAARDAGFDLFQGYFFSRPEILRQKTLSPSVITTLRLYQAVSQPEIDLGLIEQLIINDVTLSYKLLRHVNTMTASRAKPISSFKQALAFLGDARLRRFVTFVATSQATEDKPLSLYLLSLQRARFCEYLSQHITPKVNPNQAFLTGLFSLLDSMLDQPIATLINQLSLNKAIRHALIAQHGELGLLLQLAMAYDNADWPRIKQLSQILQVKESVVAERYLESLKWAAHHEQQHNTE